MNINQIGIVNNKIEKKMVPDEFKDVISTIIIEKEYELGLFRLEENKYATVVFFFHKNDKPVKLRHNNIFGEYKGVFATRTPNRPSPIGISTVEIIDINENRIRVKGLDAINETPIIDIKPFTKVFDYDKKEESQMALDIKNPRKNIMKKVLINDKKALLSEAGSLHGHYCGGLALGIHLSIVGLQQIRKFTDGIMENLLAVVEMNHCATDAIQYVTGCTFGNNSLIFEDIGKTAMTLVLRDKKAIRLSIKNNWKKYANLNPELDKLFDKVVKDRTATEEEINEFRKLSRQASFDMMNIPSEDIIKWEIVDYDPPARAPIHPDFYCEKCGEKTMGSRKCIENEEEICLKCGSVQYFRLTGHGIEKR